MGIGHDGNSDQLYFEPGQNLAQLRESCDSFKIAVAEASNHTPDFMLCAGDSNVDMHHPPSAMCALLEQTMLDLGCVRLDLQEKRRTLGHPPPYRLTH